MAWALSSGRRLLSGGLPASSRGRSAGAGSERHCLQARSCPELHDCHNISATRAVAEAQRWKRRCIETALRRGLAAVMSGSPRHAELPLLVAIISAHSMLWLVHQSPIPALGPPPDPTDSCAGVVALARVQAARMQPQPLQSSCARSAGVLSTPALPPACLTCAVPACALGAYPACSTPLAWHPCVMRQERIHSE